MLGGSGFGKNDLLSFTHDRDTPILDSTGKQLQAHSDADGTFFVTIVVPADWSIGLHILYVHDEAQRFEDNVEISITQAPPLPPFLELDASPIDFGPGLPGVVSSRDITLTNTGGGQIDWQASSDQPWLSVVPLTGKFTFSGSAEAKVIVNRSTLSPQVYTGQIKFTQLGSENPPQLLTVSMAVEVAPAPSMVLSTASLSFSASTVQNPAAQTITVQNNGNQILNWSAAAITGDGNPWLSINPSSGQLSPRTSAVVTVNVQSQSLAPGSYSGTITFTGAGNFPVTVNLSIIAPGNLLVSPSVLPISATSGQNSISNALTLQNNGGVPLDWTVNATTTDGAKWLSGTPTGGHLEVGAQASYTVDANATSLKAGTYSGTLTFTYGSSIRQVSVSFTVNPLPAAAISVQPATLSFNTVTGSNPASQTFTITDTGNATLNWSLTEDQNGLNFAPASPTSGSVLPGKTSPPITVAPNVTQQSVGTITAVITIMDSDKGTTVQSQQVKVNITITGSAAINLPTSALTFNHDSTTTISDQFLQITNTGSANLDWSLTPSSQAASYGITVNPTSGTIAPGANTLLDVACDSTRLGPGNYTATLLISDTDPNTKVLPQKINVVVVVS